MQIQISTNRQKQTRCCHGNNINNRNKQNITIVLIILLIDSLSLMIDDDL